MLSIHRKLLSLIKLKESVPVACPDFETDKRTSTLSAVGLVLLEGKKRRRRDGKQERKTAKRERKINTDGEKRRRLMKTYNKRKPSASAR